MDWIDASATMASPPLEKSMGITTRCFKPLATEATTVVGEHATVQRALTMAVGISAGSLKNCRSTSGRGA